MKRVLLTGGTGFVGANLARRLLRDAQSELGRERLGQR
jgi:nucleoside-diphosphate-sugar epimerase